MAQRYNRPRRTTSLLAKQQTRRKPLSQLHQQQPCKRNGLTFCLLLPYFLFVLRIQETRVLYIDWLTRTAATPTYDRLTMSHPRWRHCILKPHSQSQARISQPRSWHFWREPQLQGSSQHATTNLSKGGHREGNICKEFFYLTFTKLTM